MAITTTSIPVGKFGFMSNSCSADVSGAETLVAAPTTGKQIVVDIIILNSTAAIALSIGEGEGVPGTLDTTYLGPVEFSALQTITWNFQSRGGMVLTANTLLGIDADGAGNICCFVSGRIE